MWICRGCNKEFRNRSLAHIKTHGFASWEEYDDWDHDHGTPKQDEVMSKENVDIFQECSDFLARDSH